MCEELWIVKLSPARLAPIYRKLALAIRKGGDMGKANGKAQERTFTVDMWWTDLNDVEIGFFIHSRHRAKSREFTQDSDVIGEVLEGGQRAGLISYREGLWKSENPGEKRLVLKLFTPSMGT